MLLTGYNLPWRQAIPLNKKQKNYKKTTMCGKMQYVHWWSSAFLSFFFYDLLYWKDSTSSILVLPWRQGIPLSMKQYFCRKIQYVERCIMSFNAVQFPSHFSVWRVFKERLRFFKIMLPVCSDVSFIWRGHIAHIKPWPVSFNKYYTYTQGFYFIVLFVCIIACSFSMPCNIPLVPLNTILLAMFLPLIYVPFRIPLICRWYTFKCHLIHL